MRALPFLLLPFAAEAQSLADTHFRMNFCYSARFHLDGRAGSAEVAVRSISLSREPTGHMHSLNETPLRLRVTFFGDPREHRATADCLTHREALDCRIEGDGGGFRLDAEGDAVRLSMGEDGMTLGGASPQTRRLEADAEDGGIVLRRCG
jgi:hypothetical protein